MSGAVSWLVRKIVTRKYASVRYIIGGSIVPFHNRVVICLLTTTISCLFYGCARGQLTAPSALLKSDVACPGGNLPCSASIQVPQILVSGTDPATYGIPISCSVTASTQAMKLVTVPSQPWFGVSPGSATLKAGSSTTLAVTSINAANVSGRNLGVVTVSAGGYADNGQMQVALNCDVIAGTCKVAFTCDPKTNPLP